jgi:hypothetical protein
LPAGKLEATPTAVGATASATSVSRLGSVDMCTSRTRRARSDRLAEEDNKRQKGKHPLAPCTSSAGATQTLISTPLTEPTWASLTFASGFDRTTLSTNVSRPHNNCLCWNAVRQNQTMSVCGCGGDGSDGLLGSVCARFARTTTSRPVPLHTRATSCNESIGRPRATATHAASHIEEGEGRARAGVATSSGHEPRRRRRDGCVCACEVKVCALCECLHCTWVRTVAERRCKSRTRGTAKKERGAVDERR